ncbi:MAG: FAD-dependent oxidoreductase, partial [Chloroflexota bacterium]
EKSVTGVIVRDLLTDQVHTLRGKLIINCAGPWADILLNIARGTEAPQHIRRSEGIHIITKRITTGNAAVGGLTPTGRPCNLIPWRGHTLIGTTDREYVGEPDKFCVTREKIEEYIAEINASFCDPNLIHYSDVLYAYGGLRPLVDDQTKSVYQTSRKYEIFDHEQDGLSGLLTVEGGKYTTSRNLAENVLKTVNKKFGRKTKSMSARQHLAGCEIRDLDMFIKQAKLTFAEFPESTVDYLARMYGTELPQVMEIARSEKRLGDALNSDGEMPAQVQYATRHEMARTLMDVLIRRTGIGTLGHPGQEALEKVAAVAAAELNWSQTKIDSEINLANKALTPP